MLNHKHIDGICIGITVFTLLLTFLFINGKAIGIQAMESEEDSDALFTDNDQDAAWDTGNATKITLSDQGSTVSGNGAYVNHGDIYIVYAGKYVLSGELSDGSVMIEADGDDKIWLMLDEVSIHCEDGAAIRVEQAGKVFLTLRDGTENTLSSGASYCEEAVSAGVDGTIYSRDDLTVNGSGSLQVTAEYQHGIVCNDDFVITGGTLNVTAAQDAIHANDSARIKDADLTLSAGDDGITVSNDEETSFLYVESGNIRIPSCSEGLEAVQITVAGGTLDIKPTDDGFNARGYSGNSVINITGGEIVVTVENGWDADGLDSNKDITISGGKVLVSVSDSGGSCAIDYGSEYGGKCKISGGTVLACGSSGMAEGFDSDSTQGFLMQTVSASAGTTVTVKAADGKELLSETVPCSFSSVLVSTPEMNVGDTCTLLVGDTETEMTIDNSSNTGGFGGFGGGRMRGGRMFDANGLDGEGVPGEDGFAGEEIPSEDGFGSEEMPGANDFSGEGIPGENRFDGEGIPGEDGFADERMISASSLAGEGMSGEDDFAGDGMSGEDGLASDGMSGEDGLAGEGMPGEDGFDGEGIPGEDGLAGERLQGQGGFGENGGAQPPEISNGAEEGMMFPGFRQNRMEGSLQGQENASPTADSGTPISAETLLLLGISFVVLLAGCIIAYVYKRR